MSAERNNYLFADQNRHNSYRESSLLNERIDYLLTGTDMLIWEIKNKVTETEATNGPGLWLDKKYSTMNMCDSSRKYKDDNSVM